MLKSWPLLILTFASLCIAQQKGVPRGTESPIAVEMEYCGSRPGKPPLKLLSFNITVRNLADKPQWFLFPRSLYEKPSGSAKPAGVDGVEVFSTSPDHSVTIAQFMGSIRLEPESAGGFQALLLPGGAAISVHDFVIHFWGDKFSPLPLHIVIADGVMLGQTPADRWARVDLLSHKSADVNSRDLRMVRSRSTKGRNEIPVTINKTGEITVPDALAKSCPDTTPPG